MRYLHKIGEKEFPNVLQTAVNEVKDVSRSWRCICPWENSCHVLKAIVNQLSLKEWARCLVHKIGENEHIEVSLVSKCCSDCSK